MKVLLILAIVGLLIWVLRVIFQPAKQSVSTEVPAELANAKVWAKERPFQFKGELVLSGRIDEAFETANGDIVVSDTKSRNYPTVYDSDILQVSSYKLAIEQSTGRRVSDKGYVRLLTPKGNEYRQVNLLNGSEVAAAAQLYDDLRRGLYPGSKCARTQVCRTCAYKPECDGMSA